MGKIEEQSLHHGQQILESQSGSSSGLLCDGCAMGVARIGRTFSFKCFFVLILGVAVFLSALFSLRPFHAIKLDFVTNDADALNATVKAGFKLQKPVSKLVAHIQRLEYAILLEIGLPNTKVSILSMHKDDASNWTDVVFGVLSVPRNVPISPVYLSVLKSSLVELFLRRSNLSLTFPIFGEPSSFEILKFPGGITVIPLQSASVWQIPQILFNFTLYNSISQIQENFDRFKEELKFGLRLRPYENIYVQVTNKNGSTMGTPVTVEASVVSNVGSHDLLPQRLKQLAQTITGSPPAKNLGLDHSVFGKVKEVSLSSYLNRTIHTPQGSPSPSPSPSPEYGYLPPSVSPYLAPPSYAPSPSANNHHKPCFHCKTSPSYAPTPEIRPGHSSAPSRISTHPSRYNRCRSSATSPSPFPPTHYDPSPPDYSSHAPAISPPLHLAPQLAPALSPLPLVSYSSNSGINKKSGKGSISPPVASPLISPSPSLFVSGSPFKEMRLLILSGLLIFYLLCGTY